MKMYRDPQESGRGTEYPYRALSMTIADQRSLDIFMATAKVGDVWESGAKRPDGTPLIVYERCG